MFFDFLIKIIMLMIFALMLHTDKPIKEKALAYAIIRFWFSFFVAIIGDYMNGDYLITTLILSCLSFCVAYVMLLIMSRYSKGYWIITAFIGGFLLLIF